MRGFRHFWGKCLKSEAISNRVVTAGYSPVGEKRLGSDRNLWL